MALFGTVNLDIRSMSLNFELMVAIYDAAFTRELLALQRGYAAQGRALVLAEWEQRSGRRAAQGRRRVHGGAAAVAPPRETVPGRLPVPHGRRKMAEKRGGAAMIRIAGAILLWMAASLAAAQGYPTRPVTIVVPFPPGGLIDIVARIIQPKLQAELGQPVVVENRSGAGGTLGAEAVARAAPDGYTLLLANPSLALVQHIYPKLNFRPLDDLAYIGRYGSVPNVLVVRPNLPVKTVAELIEYAKKNPGKLNYASNGYGTSPQMSMELFKSMTNTFILHIPFRGSGPAVASVLAGETDLMFDNLPPVLPQIKAGRMRAAGGHHAGAFGGDAGAAHAGRAGAEGLRRVGLVRPRRTRGHAARRRDAPQPGAQQGVGGSAGARGAGRARCDGGAGHAGGLPGLRARRKARNGRRS